MWSFTPDARLASAIAAVVLLSACEAPMAADQSQGHAAAANAGLPAVTNPDRAAGVAPDAAALDQRERTLAAPRPPAGPPLH